LTDRWQALVRYDNDISAAAERLRPFGEAWVEKLGREFFALHEDRRYLANIVQTLLEDARREDALKKQQETWDWAERFRHTAEGELCTKASLQILREAEAKGYTLGLERNGSFSFTKNGVTSYLYSNADIERLGHALADLRDRGLGALLQEIRLRLQLIGEHGHVGSPGER